MGENTMEGTLTKWTKNVGDYVAEDEVYASIEIDKISVDMSACGFSGVLTDQLAKPGDWVTPHTQLAEFDTRIKI